MRITAGYARGFLLACPNNGNTRPATDAARLAAFSSIGAAVEGARVLDLFAGTGAYGLEAASRGAEEVMFVERGAAAFKALRANIEKVKKNAPAIMKPVMADCFSETIYGGKTFDLIFADPPYAMLADNDFTAKLLDLFARRAAPGAWALLEAPAEFEPPEHSAARPLKRLGKKSKGKPTQIIFGITPIEGQMP